MTAVRHYPRDLVGLVDQLARQTIAPDTELIVVDNRPRRRFWPLPDLDRDPLIQVIVVRELRAGLSIARNRGVAVASGRYIAITDPDIRPERTWLERLLSALDDTGAFCVGGRSATVYPAGTAVPLTPELRECHGPVRWPDKRAPCMWPYWMSGCNMMFERGTAQELGLFRPDLGRRGRVLLDCEDLEFVQRATQAGLLALIEPSARVIHPVRRRHTTSVWFLCQGIGHGVSVARMRSTTAIPAEAIRASGRHFGAAIRKTITALVRLDRGKGVEGARDALRIIAYRIERGRLRISKQHSRARSPRR